MQFTCNKNSHSALFRFFFRARGIKCPSITSGHYPVVVKGSESVKRVNSNQPRFGLFHHTRTHAPIHTHRHWCLWQCAAFLHPAAIKFRNLNLRSPKFAVRRRLSFTRCAWDNPVHTHTQRCLRSERVNGPYCIGKKASDGKEPRAWHVCVCWWRWIFATTAVAAQYWCAAPSNRGVFNIKLYQRHAGTTQTPLQTTLAYTGEPLSMRAAISY